MNWLAMTVGAVAAVSIGAGCVERSRYEALEMKYNDREAALAAADAEIAEAKKRDAFAAAERVAVEKEVALLKAKLEAKEIRASLEVAEAPAGAATLATGQRASAPVAPIGEGWRTNPATGGIVLDGGAIFMPGSATLRMPAAKPILDRLVAELARPEYADLLIRVDGHTDDTPISKSKNRDNWELAGKRALAVLYYLEENGVSSERLSFAGFGAHRPIDPGTTKDVRAQNRRVEIVLMPRS